MAKKYSFKKDEVIDVEAVDKTTDHDDKPKKKQLSFKDKMKNVGAKIQNFSDKVNDYKEKSYQNSVKNLEKQVKKTNLQAKLAKNRFAIDKYTKPKKKKDDSLGFGGGFL